GTRRGRGGGLGAVERHDGDRGGEDDDQRQHGEGRGKPPEAQVPWSGLSRSGHWFLQSWVPERRPKEIGAPEGQGWRAGLGDRRAGKVSWRTLARPWLLRATAQSAR